MKNVLLITDSYPPEIRSASHLMEELAWELRDRCYNVYVATSYPQYNLSEQYKGKEYPEYNEENNIKVIRIKTLPHHKVNFIVRGIAQLTMPDIFYKKIRKYITKIDIVLIYSPPLPLANLGIKIKKNYKAKFILNIQDIFPQNAIDLGVLRNKILIKYFEYMELNVYKNADVVTLHSEGNLEFIKRRYPELSNKLCILHNWIDVDEFTGIKPKGEYRKKFKLQDKFIILFAGVIGPSQGLDFVIKLAERLKDIEQLVFLMVGDGMERNNLENLVKLKNLRNVIFKDFVSKKEYPELVKDCNVGLVSLTNKNKTPVVPGKILGYMAAGIPVLAFLNKESDGHSIIKEAICGYSCEWGDIEMAEKLVRQLYDNQNTIKDLGKNGYLYVKTNFDKKHIVNKLEKLMEIGK